MSKETGRPLHRCIEGQLVIGWRKDAHLAGVLSGGQPEPYEECATQGAALTPREMAQRESLLAPPVAALLKRLAGRPAPRILLGAPLQQAVRCKGG